MRFFTWVRPVLLAALLLLPSAALAQFELPVDPDRLNGEDFTFFDNDAGVNNQVELDAQGATVTANGTVEGVAEGTVVTITYQLDYPDSMSASNRSADVAQDTQVLIGVNVDAAGEVNDYFGQAAPKNCKASVKVNDRGGPPDSPDVAQASVSCDLRSDLQELDDDATPGTPGDPPQAALDAIDAAFAERKDVKIDIGNGKLSIKHKGQAL
jgi:hypothetical protein